LSRLLIFKPSSGQILEEKQKMSDKKVVKPVALAVGAALAGSFALAGTAIAKDEGNPFEMSSLSAGYMLGAEGGCGGDKEGKGKEGSCGEGSCGGDKEGHGDKKGGEGSCGEKGEEGSCGEKGEEGSCGEKDGEGSCGGDKEKDSEGKCGEGSCGGSV
jgi:uncharacterized low-complexity protein